MTTTGPRPQVEPRWGTRRRTADEWLAAGGDRHLLKPGDDGWPTLGHELANVATRLGVPPMPHQQYIFDVAHELDPDPEMLLWYSEDDVFVMRQVGKTMGIGFPVLVHRATLMPKRLGRQLSSFTMQARDKARKKLEIDMIPVLDQSPDFRRILNPKARPGRSTREWKSSLNNGNEHLQFGRNNFLHIGTPSKESGHGDTLDLGLADEIRFYRDDSVEAGYRPSMATRTAAALWLLSTPGDHLSLYMWPKVVMGRKQVESGTFSRTAYFEFGIPEGADLDDPDVWYEHHPAVGRTQTIEFIMEELDRARRSPDQRKLDTFCQEYAGQWVRHPVIGEVERLKVIHPAVWARQKRPRDTPAAGRPALGVEVAEDGKSSAIAVAVRNELGLVQVEIINHAAGTFWLEALLAEKVERNSPVAVAYDAGGTTNAMAGPVARAAGAATVMRLSGRDWAASCQAFVTGFVEGRYCHIDQDWLNSAVDGATKKTYGAGWMWDEVTALADIAPVKAATAAVRALEMSPEQLQQRSAYEDHGLLVV